MLLIFSFKIMSDYGEIVGLNCNGSGRTCCSHDCCGKFLAINDLVRFKSDNVEIDGKLELAMKVVTIKDGVEACTVGFLPRYMHTHIVHLDNKFAQVIEIYDQSTNSYKKSKSKRNMGMASYCILDYVQETV